MPVYEFKCRSCGRQFEDLFASASQKPKTKCPSCGSTDAVKLFSTFAATSGKPDFACSDPGTCPASRQCGGSCPAAGA